MKKIFAFIVPVIFLTALVGALFNFGDYNFYRQLTKISLIEFPNPFNEWNNLIKKLNALFYDFNFTFITPVFKNVNNPSDFFANVGLFFSYLGSWLNTILNCIIYFFQSVWAFIQFIGLFLFDLIADLYYFFFAFLILLGFPLDYFMLV